jgi:hypothetical protein
MGVGWGCGSATNSGTKGGSDYRRATNARGVGVVGPCNVGTNGKQALRPRVTPPALAADESDDRTNDKRSFRARIFGHVLSPP